jgi:hypothetical protein
MLVFSENSTMISIAAGLIYILPTEYEGSFPATSLQEFVVCFLDDSHSDWTEMASQCCFDLHFLYV